MSGVLPNASLDTATVQVASLDSFLVMKGIALADRMKEKDAYDIYFCIRIFPGGLEAVVDELKPSLPNSLVLEGLQNIAKLFASPDHFGPSAVADFEEIDDAVERELVRRDVFERVSFVVRKLNLI